MDDRPSLPVSVGLYRSPRAQRLRPVPPPQPTPLRAATSKDVAFLAHLQSRFGHALGFLPKVALEWYAMDAQRRHHGLQLLADLEAKARTAGQLAIQANCAADLEATEFWKAAGFTAIAHLTPDNVRGRDVICWRKALTTKIPAWFIDLPARAGHRAAKPVSVRLHRHQFPKGI